MTTHEYEKIITLPVLSTFKDECDGLYAKKTDVPVKAVKVNSSALTPDANGAVNIVIEESTVNGKLKVNGSDVTIHGLGTAAYEASTAFDAAGSAAAVLGSNSDGSSAKTVYGAIALANEKAPTASPTFTGTPTAPTASSSTNTTQIATTEFVQAVVSAASSGSSAFQGTLSAQSTLVNTNYKRGWYWVVSTAGTYAGQTCEVGDLVYAISDRNGAYSNADFSVVQANIDMTLYVRKTELLWASDDDVLALFSVA